MNNQPLRLRYVAFKKQMLTFFGTYNGSVYWKFCDFILLFYTSFDYK
jgi:hypothetical protein